MSRTLRDELISEEQDRSRTPLVHTMTDAVLAALDVELDRRRREALENWLLSLEYAARSGQEITVESANLIRATLADLAKAREAEQA